MKANILIMKLLVKEQIDILDDLLKYKLPKYLKEYNEYYSMYTDALELYKDGKYKEAGDVLQIDWSVLNV